MLVLSLGTLVIGKFPVSLRVIKSRSPKRKTGDCHRHEDSLNPRHFLYASHNPPMAFLGQRAKAFRRAAIRAHAALNVSQPLSVGGDHRHPRHSTTATRRSA
jgi:hypothetical protein